MDWRMVDGGRWTADGMKVAEKWMVDRETG